MQLDLALDFAAAGALAVPERLGHVDVLGVVARENIGEAGAPQIFRILLANPSPVLAGLGLPVEIGGGEIAAAGVTFDNDRGRRQRAQ